MHINHNGRGKKFLGVGARKIVYDLGNKYVLKSSQIKIWS
ncbi:hypothetical protein SAMN04487897_1712 [Paenibacillus sp. yr247]|nr:hypothetical protein SAMN04487897_1712 [Paenibacillus sp. yr247]